MHLLDGWQLCVCMIISTTTLLASDGENNTLSRLWFSNFSVLWTVYVPQILVEILIPIVMILGCAFFSRQLGLKGEALMIGLVPL